MELWTFVGTLNIDLSDSVLKIWGYVWSDGCSKTRLSLDLAVQWV